MVGESPGYRTILWTLRESKRMMPLNADAEQGRGNMTKRRKSSVGWGIVGALFLLGLIIAYWYVFLPLAIILVVAGLIYRSKQQRKQEYIARHRPGPRDPWLNEIAVALADFEFTEFARNTGAQVGGVPIEGDIRLDAPRFSVVVTLLETADLAHQAEIALRARPDVRNAIADGKTMVRAEGRVLYTANGRGGVVDEARLNEVTQIVDAIPIGPSRVPPNPAGLQTLPPPAPLASRPPHASPPKATVARQPAQPVPQLSTDVLDQIKRLAELRDSGAITSAEFETKKAELLRRF